MRLKIVKCTIKAEGKTHAVLEDGSVAKLTDDELAEALEHGVVVPEPDDADADEGAELAAKKPKKPKK